MVIKWLQDLLKSFLSSNANEGDPLDHELLGNNPNRSLTFKGTVTHVNFLIDDPKNTIANLMYVHGPQKTRNTIALRRKKLSSEEFNILSGAKGQKITVLVNTRPAPENDITKIRIGSRGPWIEGLHHSAATFE